MLFETHPRRVRFGAALPGLRKKGDDLDAKVVFEIKDGGSVTKTRSQLTLRSNDRSRMADGGTLSLRKRMLPLLFAGLLLRNRDSDVTGWTGFACIVRGERAAG